MPNDDRVHCFQVALGMWFEMGEPAEMKPRAEAFGLTKEEGKKVEQDLRDNRQAREKARKAIRDIQIAVAKAERGRR